MSRILAPALLAAVRAFGGQPTVTLDIADRRLHWRPLIAGADGAEFVSDVVDDTLIHRIRTLGAVAQVDIQIEVEAPA